MTDPADLAQTVGYADRPHDDPYTRIAALHAQVDELVERLDQAERERDHERESKFGYKKLAAEWIERTMSLSSENAALRDAINEYLDSYLALDGPEARREKVQRLADALASHAAPEGDES